MGVNPQQHDLFPRAVVTALPQRNKSVKLNKTQLIEELTSIGNPSLTRQIAELIANEVDKEIDRRRLDFLTNELISEMVAAKLEELGLISARKISTQELAKPAAVITQPADEFLPQEVLEALVPTELESKGKLLTIKPPLRKIPLELSLEAAELIQRDWCLKDGLGKSLETAEQALTRVARALAEAEVKYAPMTDLNELETHFYNLMASREFLPDAAIFKNLGNSLSSLFSTVTIPVRDSTEAIFEAMKQAAILHKHGISAGFSFTHLRPRSDIVRSSGKTSSGPVSFMRVFHLALKTVLQEGFNGRPNHAILNVDHPDILDFIRCFEGDTPPEDFHLSVGLTDDFLAAVEANQTYALTNPRSGERVEEIRARKVFKNLVHQALSHAQPSVLFMNRLEQANPTPKAGRLEATNAAGDTPLLPFEGCLGGAINLAKVAESGEVDWEKLKQIVHRAVHFLDNAVSINRHPFPETQDIALKNRKISLGVMGWAELLSALGVSYTSDEAVNTAAQLMAFIQREAEIKSTELAKARGAFPNWDLSVFKGQGIKRRNATVTGLIDTQTLSQFAGCTPGIEPSGESSPIPYEWHLRMQATFQNHTENAVSKAIPVSSATSEEEIAMIFLLGYQLGVKGITLKKSAT